MDSVIKLFKQYKIKQYKNIISKVESNFKLLGTGKNGSVYLLNLKNKQFAIKKQELFLDTPLILSNTSTCLITQTAINEIIITNIILNIYSLFNNSIKQKFYGYIIDKNYIYMIQDYFPNTYTFNVIYNKISNFELYVLTIHILYHIFFIFEHYLLGHHNDLKFENILIYKTDQKWIKYTFNDGKTINLKVFGYLPIIIDFGSTALYKINENNNNIIINRHVLYKNIENEIENKKLNNLNYLCNDKFKKQSNLQLFMFIYIKKINNNNFIINEFKNILKYKNNNSDKIELGINDFLNNKNIFNFIKKNMQ